MLGFVAFVVMVSGWFFIARQLKKKGLGGITRHLIGGALGCLLFLLTPAVYFSFTTDSAPSTAKQAEQPEQKAPTEQPAPESTKGEMWEYLVNNAARAINRYAYDTNPDAVILGRNGQIDFELQQGGEYDGRYLLTLTDNKDDNERVVTLLPLFDEYAPSDDLDDEAEQWKILEATFNGRPLDAGPELVSSEKQFDFTPSVFEQRFNRIMSENTNLSLLIDTSEIESGQTNDTVTATIGKYTSGVLVVDKVTGNLISVTVIGSGDGSIDSGAEIMAVGAAAQAAAAQTQFNDVLMSISDMIEGDKLSINGVRLSVTQPGELGTWFVAEPI